MGIFIYTGDRLKIVWIKPL